MQSNQKEYQNLDSFTMPPDFRGRPGWVVQLWWLVEFFLFKPSPQFMYGWRRWILKRFGAKIGRNVIIRPSCSVTYPWKITLGDNVWIGNDVVLYSLGPIKVGNNSVISQRSYICTGGHDYNHPAFTIFSKEIIIEDECWLATDVYVAPGVTIGQGTVVGARSSVFKDLPSGKICMGTPARIIRNRNACIAVNNIAEYKFSYK